MNPKFARYIFLGMVIGAFFGLIWQSNGNAALGILYGGLGGAGLGWFIAAALSQSESQRNSKSKK